MLKIANKLFLKTANESYPEYFYHVTFLNRLDSIAEVGLQINYRPSIGNMSDHFYSKGKLFLGDENGIFHWFNRAEDTAEAESDNIYEDNFIPVVLRISSDDFDVKEDKRGSHDVGYHGGKAWFIEQNIPPEDIEVFNGSEWIDIQDYNLIDPMISLDVEVLKNENTEEGEEENYEEEGEETLYYFKENNPLRPEFNEA